MVIKHLIKWTAVILAVVMIFPLSVFAAKQEDTIYLEDGSYITVRIEESGARDAFTKTGSKTYIYRSSSGEQQWKAILTGTFIYNGISASCTSSNCTVTVTNTDWYVISKTATKGGGTAFANLTIGKKLLGVTVDRETINMSLTCDKNGNLS